MRDYLFIYRCELPEGLMRLARSPEMLRLRGVGMNCGCEYSSFPRFRGIESYSRYEHSLGAAMLTLRFSGSLRQSAAALLHDIATPVFAHVVDFMRGDHLSQTATESGTEELIASSASLREGLAELSLAPEDVSDYHRYPLADNPTPRLSADRLEYTCGNAINFSFASRAETAELTDDLMPGENEFGEPELVFRSPDKARRFAALALECSRVYVCDADRYSMQTLAELLRDALDAGAIGEADLRGTESALIKKLLADEPFAARWRAFTALSSTRRAAEPQEKGVWRRIPAKRRHIDPFIEGRGRASAVFADFGAELAEFLAEEQESYICGE